MDMIDKIRVLQSDTHSLPNTRADGGSTTSEGACQASLKACAVLVERLLPIKESLTKAQADGKVPWPTLCLKVPMPFPAQEFGGSKFLTFARLQ
jgi:hypothetical protein